MISLVNEQDRMNAFTKDLVKQQKLIIGAQEDIVSTISELEDRYKVQEKALGDYYSHTRKEFDSLSTEMIDANRNLMRLHIDSEKRLSEMHTETHKELEKNRLETLSRLLALDGIESALGTLLIRTEPPVKKPFWLFRPFKKMRLFFSAKLSIIIAKHRLRKENRRG